MRSAGKYKNQGSNPPQTPEASLSDALSGAYSARAAQDRASAREVQMRLGREQHDYDYELRLFDILYKAACDRYPERDLDELEDEVSAKVKLRVADRKRRREEEAQQAAEQARQRRRTEVPSPRAEQPPPRAEEPSPSLGRGDTNIFGLERDMFRE